MNHETLGNHTKRAINSALAGVFALGLGIPADAVLAKETATEKCAGIVRANQNDCATSSTACHGSVPVDSHPEAWIYLPKGSCEKIVGGHITLQRAPDEQASKGRRGRDEGGRPARSRPHV